MNKFRFRALPKTEIEQLPFYPDERTFVEWLEAFTAENNQEICLKLALALHALNQTELNPGLRFKLLSLSVPFVDEIAKKLGKVYFDSGFPLTSEELSNVEILVWTYTQLTMSFSDLSYQLELDHIDWNVHQKAQIVFLAMYTSSRVLLYASLVYSEVPKGFWLNSYRIFLSAETNDLLTLPISIAHLENKTIDGLFKKMLIFSCCDSDCFSVSEMTKLYEWLDDCAEYVVFSKKRILNNTQTVFRLDLDSDQCPKKDSPYYEFAHVSTCFIDAWPFADYLIERSQRSRNQQPDLRFLDKGLIAKVVDTLTKEHHRKYTRLTYSENAKGFIGFKAIVSMLSKLQSDNYEWLIRHVKTDPRLAGNWEVPNFELIPEGDEIAYSSSKNKSRWQSVGVDSKTTKIRQLAEKPFPASNIWSQSESFELMNTVPYSEFLILNNSVKGYELLWKSEDMGIRVGELFAVQPNGDNRLELGLVIRITRVENDGLKLGVELMGMQSELVWLVEDGTTKQQGQLAVFVPMNPLLHQPNSIVMNFPVLKSGQGVEIYRSGKKIRYRLGRKMHTTNTLQHFELDIKDIDR